MVSAATARGARSPGRGELVLIPGLPNPGCRIVQRCAASDGVAIALAAVPQAMARALLCLGGVSSRILVVDDDEAIAFALKRFFESRGYEVDAASELEEAQALVTHRQYATVIADLRLGGIYSVDGLELADYIRGVSPSTRTILLTAYASEELEVAARLRGVDAVLRKPQQLADLARLIDSFGER